jgi:hypothetical protein
MLSVRPSLSGGNDAATSIKCRLHTSISGNLTSRALLPAAPRKLCRTIFKSNVFETDQMAHSNRRDLKVFKFSWRPPPGSGPHRSKLCVSRSKSVIVAAAFVRLRF